MAALFSLAFDCLVYTNPRIHDLAISMGLFLQKTNIIRDYLEDILETRQFWPKDIWYTPPPLLRLLTVVQGQVH